MWGKYTDLINYASSGPNICVRNYDFEFSGGEQASSDMSVQCTGDSLNIYKHLKGSGCAQTGRQLSFAVDWTSMPEVCINDASLGISYKFKKNVDREHQYYKQVYAIQEWLKINQFDSNAGTCVLYGY